MVRTRLSKRFQGHIVFLQRTRLLFACVCLFVCLFVCLSLCLFVCFVVFAISSCSFHLGYETRKFVVPLSLFPCSSHLFILSFLFFQVESGWADEWDGFE